MDTHTQGSLEITCVQGSVASSSPATTTCSIANFGMLYLPFAYMLFLMVFAMVVSFFILRVPKPKNYG